jgi:fatty-acyl-CoA synthase
MNDRGVGSWIERRARTAPDKAALIHGETRRTYAEVADRVRRLARGLSDLGVERGHRVGWLGANHPAFLEVFFATAKLGAVLAPMSHRLDAAVTSDLLRDFSPTVVVVERAAIGVALPRDVRFRVVVNAESASDVDYEQLIAASRDDPFDDDVAFHDLCMLPHTSGTTGMPKGVMLTHGNITWNVVNLLSVAEFRNDDVTVAVAPFFRTGGTGVNVLPVLFKGGTVVIPEAGDPDEILDVMERWHITIGFGNPDLLDALTRSPRWSAADLSAIRVIMTGGAPVPEHLIRAYMQRGVTFLQGYGLSEAAPLVLLLDAQSASRKVGSAGKPPLFVDVRVTRPDGTQCKRNEAGELLVRGPNVMAGYWNRPVETQETLDDEGWLHTGDAARIDEENFVWIVDRVADAFHASGHVVYPGDIERVLMRHPAVVDAGIASDDGESRAFVVRAPDIDVTEAELVEFSRAQLEPYEVPRSIMFLDRLPRNSVGKLLRQQLLRVPEASA